MYKKLSFLFLLVVLFPFSLFATTTEISLLARPERFATTGSETSVKIFSKPGEFTFTSNSKIEFEPATGVTITSSIMQDEHNLQINFTTRNVTPGARSIKITDGGNIYIAKNVIYFGDDPFKMVAIGTPDPNNPRLVSLTNKNYSGRVTFVAGPNTTFGSTGSVSISPNNGITISNISFLTNQVSFDLECNNAPAGYKEVTITTGGNIYKVERAFTIGKSIQGGFLFASKPTNGSGTFNNIIFQTPMNEELLVNADSFLFPVATKNSFKTVSITDNHNAKGNLTISSITSQIPMEFKKNSQIFFIQPLLVRQATTESDYTVSAEPNSFEQGAEGRVVFTFNTIPSGTPTLTSSTGIEFSSITVLDKTVIATISVDSSVSDGKKSVTFQFPSQKVVSTDVLTITKAVYTISPSEAKQGETVKLTIKSQESSFDGEMEVTITGLTLPTLEKTDSKTIVFNDVLIPENSFVGPKDVKIFKNGSLLKTVTFKVKQGENTKLLSVTPSRMDRGMKNYVVTFVGQNTHFSMNSVISSDNDTVSGIPTIASNEMLQAEINVSIDAPVGKLPIKITTGYESVELKDALTITSNKGITIVDPSVIEEGTHNIELTLSESLTEDSFFVWISGEGAIITNTSKLSSDKLSITVTTNDKATGELRDIAVIQGESVFYKKEALDIKVPTLVKISPTEVVIGKTATLKLIGEDTTFDVNTTPTFSPEGITVLSKRANSATELEFGIEISEDLSDGDLFSVSVEDQGRVLTLKNAIIAVSEKSDDGGCSFSNHNSSKPILMLTMLTLLSIFVIRRKYRIIQK
ncbi:hypothetical protein JXR93_01330 [bacterium]|nr:hypothetical protein [bacterium]